VRHTTPHICGTSKEMQVAMFGDTNHYRTCYERYALRDPQPHVHRHSVPGYAGSEGDDEFQLRGQHDLNMHVTVARVKRNANSRREYSTPIAVVNRPTTTASETTITTAATAASS
jgi:hypothetical protein